MAQKHSTPNRIRLSRSDHFARVSHRYDSIRTLHQGVIDRSVAAVPDLVGPIRIISIGVGTGRYFLPFLRRLAEDPRIDLRGVGLDREPAMLRQLLVERAKGTDTPLSLVQADAHSLPFRDRSATVIHCVNAVHHFQLQLFLSEADRVLAPGGRLLIYTRTPEQNERTIWGRLFPGFVEREGRLHALPAIRNAIGQARHLTLIELKEVQNAEHTSPARLIEQARKRHYSTFTSYAPEEFERALSLFCHRLTKEYGESPSVHLVHENLWVTAERNAGS